MPVVPISGSGGPAGNGENASDVAAANGARADVAANVVPNGREGRRRRSSACTLPRSRENPFVYRELGHFHAASVEQLLASAYGRAGAVKPPPPVMALFPVAVALRPPLLPPGPLPKAAALSGLSDASRDLLRSAAVDRPRWSCLAALHIKPW